MEEVRILLKLVTGLLDTYWLKLLLLMSTLGDVAVSTLGLLLLPLPPAANRNALVVPPAGASSTSIIELVEDLKDQPFSVPL